LKSVNQLTPMQSRSSGTLRVRRILWDFPFAMLD
jgi:hypothetical protein